MTRPKWTPIDVVVIMLTGTICGCLSAAIIKPLVTGQDLTDSKAKLVTSIMASIIAIISMYVGAKLQANKDGE